MIQRYGEYMYSQNIIKKIFHLQINESIMEKSFTTIEQYVIDAVQKRREELGMTPNELSLEIGISRGVIGKIENSEKRDKYNLNQLNEIAKVLKCKVADFLPDPYVEEDCLEEYHEIREERLKRKKNPKS